MEILGTSPLGDEEASDPVETVVNRTSQSWWKDGEERLLGGTRRFACFFGDGFSSGFSISGGSTKIFGMKTGP